MFDYTFAGLVRSIQYRLLASKTRVIPNNDLIKSAMVFAPHPDDETLGCGGTIIRKTESGADVSVVFMTDGGASHPQFMQRAELGLLRKSEGAAATRALGVKSEHTFFLGFPDGRLVDHTAQAYREVANLLELQKPEQVFLPYAGEPIMWSYDHVTTTKVILDAVRNCPWPITVYEYPIWAWFHYPWIQPRRGNRRPLLKSSVKYQFGARLLLDFNFKLDIDNIINRKRAALECHRSQMTELIPDVGWTTLQTIDRDFLNLFFQKYEYFRRKESSPLRL